MTRALDTVESLIPHRGVARLLTAVTGYTNDRVEGLGWIPAGHVLSHRGVAPAYLAIEIGAQAAAALEALARANSPAPASSPRLGHLVRVREAHFHRIDLPVETTLIVRARLEGSAPPLAIYEIEVTLDDAVAVRARISTHGAEAQVTS